MLTACARTEPTVGPKVKVEMSDFKYTPSMIVVPTDERFTIDLRNRGSVEHDLVIDAVGVKALLKPGQSALRVIGPLTAGTELDVYCSITGHKEAGMVGKMIAR